MSRVSLATIAVAAFFAAVVLPRATLPMADGDAWWHIHAGEEVLATGRVPEVNTWTIAGEGFRWTSQDWLSNVLMAVIFDTGAWGIGLLSLAFALAVVAAFGFLWLALDRRAHAPGWFARLIFLTAGLVVAGPIIGIRVQTIDLLMAAVVVWILWAYVARPDPMRLILLPLVAALWVNLHAGWVMLFLLGGAVLIGEGLDRWLGRGLDPDPLSPRALGWLAGALIASAAALVLNPNGVAIYAYPFETASIAAHRDFLVEWSPPDLASFEGQATVAFVVLGVVPTFALRWRRLRVADGLWLLGLTILALSAVRFALFLGPIGAALAALYLAPRIRGTRVGESTGPVLDRLTRPPRSARERAVNAGLLAIVVLLGTGLAVARANPAAQQPAIEMAVPIGAAEWIAEHDPDARIFNTYAWGGYLSRELPRAKAYIDGRSDIYGDAPIQRFAATLNASEDPSILLDQAAIDIVLVRPETPLNGWLEDHPGWEIAYDDDVALLWQRTGAGP